MPPSDSKQGKVLSNEPTISLMILSATSKIFYGLRNWGTYTQFWPKMGIDLSITLCTKTYWRKTMIFCSSIATTFPRMAAGCEEEGENNLCEFSTETTRVVRKTIQR